MIVHNAFKEKMNEAKEMGRRLVVPLVGFPGINMTNSTIKLAQQNHGEHFRIIQSMSDAFKPDAIFPLMDLSVEANALGRFTVFPKTDTPTVVKDEFSIDQLERKREINIAFDGRLLGYVETVKMMSLGLPKSTIKGAYVSGPYSLAALIMGADDAAMATVLNPDELHELCHFATEKIQQYIRLLIAAGAQAICILEPSAVMLGPDHFTAFSADYVRHIVDSCKFTGVATIYHTCGNTMHLIKRMADTGIDAVSLDSASAGVNLPTAAQALPEDVAIMGNINPTGSIFSGAPEEVEAEVNDLMKKMEPHPNFILSTGCDLPQDTPLENINAFIRAGRQYKA